jgi:hypothetical protein
MKSLSHLQVSGNEDDAEDLFDMNISGSEGDSVSAEEHEAEVFDMNVSGSEEDIEDRSTDGNDNTVPAVSHSVHFVQDISLIFVTT